MADGIKDLRSLPLFEIIGAPLMAVVQADVQATRATVDFIQTVGFTAPPTGSELDAGGRQSRRLNNVISCDGLDRETIVRTFCSGDVHLCCEAKGAYATGVPRDNNDIVSGSALNDDTIGLAVSCPATRSEIHINLHDICTRQIVNHDTVGAS